MNIILAGVTAYVLAQLLIGLWASQKVRTESDYLLAGRSLGIWTATLSVFATWFGAEACIGTAGAVYDEGLRGATADPFGYAICLVAMGLIFAVPLWKLGLTTLADLFRMRYSRGVESLAVLMMVPTSIGWAAAQIRAFGQVLSASSGAEVEMAMTLATVVVVLYTMVGGMRSDVITDMVQGVVLVAGLVVLFVVVAQHQGGVIAMAQSVDPARLKPFGGPEVSWLETLERWAVPTVGSMVAPELVSRILATRNPGIGRRAGIFGGGLYLLIGLIPVSLGLVALRLMPGVEEGEQILPLLAQQYLGTAAYVLFAGALISAILSTVNSALLSAGGLAAHNFIAPLIPGLGDLGKLRLARAAVVASGIVAYVLALRSESIYQLVADASAFGGGGVFIVVTFGLFTRIGGIASAYAAFVAGMLAWFWGSYVQEIEYSYVVSIVASLVAYLVFAPVGSRGVRSTVPQ
ncbi:MAG: sodium:solute symporter family protein [Panacagrimonas sp.]